MKMHGIEYILPQVVLLQETGLGVPEYSARTCYDSFDSSENDSIKELNKRVTSHSDTILDEDLSIMNDIEHSELLNSLAWTHFHHSILEHANLSFLVKGTSRGVLQEHARHRIQAISVRSTRYTMSSVINAFVASQQIPDSREWFIKKLLSFDMLVTVDEYYNTLEFGTVYDKLMFQYREVEHNNENFMAMCVPKSSTQYLIHGNADNVFRNLQNGKKKRNVGDAFKHIVSDNWKVDMVVTFNLRSLKNYFALRDSGAAYFQIQWLAKEIKKVTPEKYLKLIVK